MFVVTSEEVLGGMGCEIHKCNGSECKEMKVVVLGRKTRTSSLTRWKEEEGRKMRQILYAATSK